MHVAIWQQFASNHSGYFWVAGTFQTVEQAQAAFDTLRAMLKAIDRFQQDHSEESQAHRAKHYTALPPEINFAIQYDVEWPQTIDWTGWGEYWTAEHPGYKSPKPPDVRAQALIDEALELVGRTVTAQNPDQTWMTTQPFEAILQRLGAQTIGYDHIRIEAESSENFELHNRLTFTAPDVTTAGEIDNDLSIALNTGLNLPDKPPPWHDDQKHYQQVLGKSRLLRAEAIAILEQNWQRDYDRHKRVTKPEYHSPKLQERLGIRSHMGFSRQDRTFSLNDLWFHNQGLGLSAFIAYLEAKGCTDIDFAYLPLLDEEE